MGRLGDQQGSRGREPSTWTKAKSGPGAGQGVYPHVTRTMIREMGLDPDRELEVNRYVYDSERAEMRLRFRYADEDEE